MTLTWLIFAALPPLLHSLSNLVDQYIIRIHTAKSPAAFIALAGVSCLPLLLCLGPWVFATQSVTVIDALLVMVAALFFSACVVPYFHAIAEDDAHTAVPVFQTAPVFVAALSWITLGETLNIPQMIGGVIVVLAAAASLIDLHHIQFKTRPFVLITLSSILYACFVVILRSVAPDMDWMMVTFWLCTAWFLLGVGILSVARGMRTALWVRMRQTKGRLYALSTWQEFADVGASASLVAALAFTAVPAAITELVGGLQPFFITLFCFLAARVMPAVYTFDASRKVLIQKGICFIAMIFGLALVTAIIKIP